MQKQPILLNANDIQARESKSRSFISNRPQVSITTRFQRQTLSPSKKIPRFPNLQSPLPQFSKYQATSGRLTSEETL
jgi:hypothetical protein